MQCLFTVYPQRKQVVIKTCPQVVGPVQKLSISCETTKKKSKKISTGRFSKRGLNKKSLAAENGSWRKKIWNWGTIF